MKEKRKYAGSYEHTATRWGQLVNGYHIVSTQDNMLGIDGNRDILVMKDAYSGFKAAYPMPDKKGGFDGRRHQFFVWDIARSEDSTPTARVRSSGHCVTCV